MSAKHHRKAAALISRTQAVEFALNNIAECSHEVEVNNGVENGRINFSIMVCLTCKINIILRRHLLNVCWGTFFVA